MYNIFFTEALLYFTAWPFGRITYVMSYVMSQHGAHTLPRQFFLQTCFSSFSTAARACFAGPAVVAGVAEKQLLIRGVPD